MDVSDFFRPPDLANSYVVRLLAGKPFYYSVRMHRIGSANYFCHKNLAGSQWLGKCKACEQYNACWSNQSNSLSLSIGLAPTHFPGSQAEFETAVRNIKPVERHYYNVVPRNVENPQVKVLSIGKSLHQLILENIVGKERTNIPPLGDVTHPIDGRDLMIVKNMVTAGGNAFPDYSKSFFLPPSPLGTEEEIARYMDQRYDLTVAKNLKSEEELEAALVAIFGMPGRSKKRPLYRSIMAPFEPGW